MKPLMLLIAEEQSRVSFRLMCNACDSYEDGTGSQEHMIKMLEQYDAAEAMADMERKFRYLNDVSMWFAKGEVSEDVRIEAMADYNKALVKSRELIALSGLKVKKEVISGYIG